MASSSDTQTFSGEYQVVFEAAGAAAQAEGMKVKSADPATGLITVSAKMSVWSWGEDATIKVGQIQPGSISVSVQSKSKMALVDWGKNKKNVTRVLARVGTVLQSRTATAGTATWHADPTGRHEQRYWDGAAWTDQVSDGGVVATDPI